jgi:CHRD domain-containing protein
MSCESCSVRAPLALAAMLVLALAPAWAAAPSLQGELDPCPSTPATRANVVGSGTVSASLDGDTLTVSGNFSDLSSPATSAHLRMGLAMGVPGPVIGDLKVPHEVAGAITGKVTLSPEQVTALHRSSVYVQIESVKAPDGNLWAWLEAPH